MTRLSSLHLAGWKSIGEADIELRPLNLLIGGNGAGKSNLVSFFKLMQDMAKDRFQEHVIASGGADAVLHFGSKRTPTLEADFRFTTTQGFNRYFLRLAPIAGNTLMFAEEVGSVDRNHARSEAQ